MYEWSRIVWRVMKPRMRAAVHLGIFHEDLEVVGAVAALEAEASWEPDGGRTMSSWVYLNVEFAIRNHLAKVGREFARELSDDDMDTYPTGGQRRLSEDPETRVLVSEALGYLQARLTQSEWWLLWMFHGEGYSCKEMAKELGLSYGRIRNKLSEARQHAVTILEPEARCL